MKAIILESQNTLKLKEIAMLAKTNKEALLKVLTCSLCRTDAKMWKYGHRDLVYPRILGHEICAIDQQSGIKYIIWPGISCNNCQYCNNGVNNLCDKIKIMGFNYDGGLSDFILADKESLISMPEGLSEQIACLSEPLACAINAIEQAKIKQNDHVLIYGAGPVGLMLAIEVVLIKAIPVIVEHDNNKLNLSTHLRDLMSISILKKADDRLFNAVINATSSYSSFYEGINKLQKGGTYCLFSGLTDIEKVLPESFLNKIHYNQLNVVGAYGCTKNNMVKAIEHIKIYQSVFELLVSEIITLDAVEEALNKIILNKTLKIVVKI